MSQRKLLLADDSITIQKVVNLTFADEGIEVVAVGDGDAAMERLSAFNPDLIMADVNMPGLNGYQICERIKQSDEFNKIPVILLVGSFEPFDESEAQRVGADDFLTKPFQSIRQLVNKVNELLDADENKSFPEENEYSENSPVIQDEDSYSEAAQSSFTDNEIDDEMIQTIPSGFGLDETGKFETKETFESSSDLTETQPLSDEAIRNISGSGNEEFSSANNLSTDNYSGEQNFQETYPEETHREFSRPSDLDFDDDFLLELPPDENEIRESEISEEAKFVGSEEIEQAEPATISDEDKTVEIETKTEETAIASEDETVDSTNREEISTNYNYIAEPGESEREISGNPEQAETQIVDEQEQPNTASFVASSQLSPETIDIIVQKVVEKLSDKAVRDVAWEVVPQMTDLIVKKMAEEKLKES